jgi:dTMP kinase
MKEDKMPKGKLIVIEGTDSSGKETQARNLVKRLSEEGVPCTRINFPRYDTPTGRIIGQCYLGKKNLGKGDTAWFGDADSLNPEIASLYYAADRMAAKEEMLNILDSGTNLILDRYVSSNMGHQGGKESNIFSRRKIINFIEKLEYGLLGLPQPEKVIFLFMPFEVGMELRENKNEIADGHESNIEHLKRAEESYLCLAEEKNWEKIECVPDGTIDSLRTPEDIGEEVYQKVEKIIKQ